MRRLLVWIPVVALVVAAVVTARWDSGTEAAPSPSRPPAPSPSAAQPVGMDPPPWATGVPGRRSMYGVQARSVSQYLLLRVPELPDGFTSRTVDRASNDFAPSLLDRCGGPDTSSAYRTAVQRRSFQDRRLHRLVSHEVVVLANGYAGRAILELAQTPACAEPVRLPAGPGVVALLLRTREASPQLLLVHRRADVVSVLAAPAADRRLVERLGRQVEGRLAGPLPGT